MRIAGLTNCPDRFLTDGGLETYMTSEEGFDLPCFSAAVLLDTHRGRRALTQYYERFINIARAQSAGFVMDAPTWRAGLAWAEPMSQTQSDILATNARVVAFAAALRDRHETSKLPILVNGLVGPAGDAYAPDTFRSAKEAQENHQPQVGLLSSAMGNIIELGETLDREYTGRVSSNASERDLIRDSCNA